MENLIASFSYYAGHTADKMGVPKEDKIIRACVELMFNVMSEQGSAAAINNPLHKNIRALEDTINWIQPRYEALKKYAPDFFKDYTDTDLDAVTVALLCTGFTHMAHIMSDKANADTTTLYKNDTIPWNVVERAEDLIDEAENITGRVMDHRKVTAKENLENRAIEAAFVAHAFLSDILNLTDEGQNLEYYTVDDFDYLMKNILIPIRNYVHVDTRWGQDILKTIERHERHLRDSLGAQPQPERKKPVLTLVHSTPV
jgi:hypothetical protein